MGKKLNLVLREPVKLHESNMQMLKDSSDFEDYPAKLEPPKIEKPAKTEIKEFPQIEAEKIFTDTENPIEKMPPRVRQIWEYFCEAARADGDLKNSFTVTRAEVMKNAGIGSTNTYRDALGRFKSEGLIEIELRPGVNAGSVFYLTEKGIKLAEI